MYHASAGTSVKGSSTGSSSIFWNSTLIVTFSLGCLKLQVPSPLSVTSTDLFPALVTVTDATS